MTEQAPTLYPAVRFRDAPAAILFLERAFGFEALQVIANEDGSIAHAELGYGPSILMLGSEREDSWSGVGSIYVAVADADQHCQQARAAGAEIISEPYGTDYGSRDYTARDPEGSTWHFGTYRPSVETSRSASAEAVG